MKKKRILIVAGIILLALILVQNIMFRLVLNGYVVNDVYGDGMKGRLTEEEIETLDELFNSGESSLSTGHCVHNDFYIIINGDVYQPALCGYDTVYCATKFTSIDLNQSQADILKEILLNHIEELPTW